MPPLILEGNNLGQRHRHYNKLLKEALDKSSELEKINFDEDDVNNLLKIDVACNRRNVEYIMEVLKCEDMLYVTRAIKQSTFLITDKQYSHIVNPKYLHKHLFPQMTPKAINKLLLHIRLNLNDEKRIIAFYSYVNEKDPKAALKWIQYCSVAFIKKVVKRRSNDISMELLKRLCKKSLSILYIFIRNYEGFKNDMLKSTMFLLKSYTKEYLDFCESISTFERPYFTAKATQIIMKKCPERILDNFQTYSDYIDLSTFAKLLNKSEVRQFLLEQKKRSGYWFHFENVKHFLIYMPKEDILKMLTIIVNGGSDNDSNDESDDHSNDGNNDESNDESNDSWDDKRNDNSNAGRNDLSNHDHRGYKIYHIYYAIEGQSNPANVYRWYQFAPFEIALHDIKKLIYADSSPDERNALLVVLLNCAGSNIEHIRFVLQYYHDKHVNEPFKYKIQFVNDVLSQTDVHTFDEKTWSILNELFHSMEVYIESKNNVQLCIKSIIIYKVLHNEVVPEIIESKFHFNTLKSYKNKLNKDEQQKIFDYLYNFLIIKLHNHDIKSEFKESIKLLETIWSLVKDWNKEEIHYSFIIDKIHHFIDISRETSRNIKLCSLYKMMNVWRRHLFEQSVIMCPSGDVCVNALKHNPELLVRHKNEVEAMCCDDTVSQKKFLSKLRIYWPESLACDWSNVYLGRLKSISGHKALIRGIYVLFPRKKLLDFIKMYTPTETKVNWSSDDEIELSLRRHIAKSMHLARPQLPTDVVLWYAKGDYLQYTLLSFKTIYYNLKSINILDHIQILLTAPVSLQKHGIRLVFSKLKTKELLPISLNSWKSSKNSSIRTVLFTSIFNLLCKEKKPMLINEIWKVLSTFIDNLTDEENKIIYNTLGSVSAVPLLVISSFYAKSYIFLKSLPKTAGCSNIIEGIERYAVDVIEYLDADFVENTLLKSTNEIFLYSRYTFLHIIAAYLLCCKDEQSQIKKYHNVLGAVLNDVSKFKNIFQMLLQLFCSDLRKYVFEKKMIMPVAMLTDLQKAQEKVLSTQKEYVILTNWKLTVSYIKLLDKLYQNSETNTWEQIHEEKKVLSLFGEICLQCLEDDLGRYFPSIYLLFADALQKTFKNFDYDSTAILEALNAMLGREDILESYLLVLKMLPTHHYGYEAEAIWREIIRKINSNPSEELKMHYFQRFPENRY